MARIARPWFYKQTGWWMAYVHGRKEKLAEGRGNKKQALIRLKELQLQSLKNPTPESPEQSVDLRFTGCRPGEVAKLTWSDIDWRTECIVLKNHKTRRTQKTPRPRVIPMHPVVVKLLRVLETRGESDHVFLNRYKRPWKKDALVLRMVRARTAAGVPSEAKLYGVRHAFDTRAILNSVDTKTVAELMGHTSTRTTEGYLHLAGQNRYLAAAMLQVKRSPSKCLNGVPGRGLRVRSAHRDPRPFLERATYSCRSYSVTPMAPSKRQWVMRPQLMSSYTFDRLMFSLNTTSRTRNIVLLLGLRFTAGFNRRPKILLAQKSFESVRKGRLHAFALLATPNALSLAELTD